jgi:protein-tyrosine phosphatase
MFATSSGIDKLGGGQFSLIATFIDRDNPYQVEINPLKPLSNLSSILVVCDGNHCRSPMAEALFKAAVGEEMVIDSAGLTALQGVPADILARLILAEAGLDISGHRGRQLTTAIALTSDLILVMDERQKRECERLVPSARGRVYLLGQWQPPSFREIPDPFQRGAEAFQQAFAQIQQSVADWIPRLIRKQR